MMLTRVDMPNQLSGHGTSFSPDELLLQIENTHFSCAVEV